MNIVTLDKTLDIAMQLPLEQQEMLLEIIGKRRIEVNRREMAKDAEASITAFRAGKLKSQLADEVIAELHQTIEDIG
ncbi:MAG: hypothetical protein KAI50_04445 [Desulfobacterales bacterium]|nr:hypothetical protein [Desulfobacterales bacterium]